ncbi:MAG: NAD-dependent epimerase/dehydratase family protein [Alphaproteobacteria bacterium]
MLVKQRARRLVFFDNLYMYGPQTAPLNEDTPLTDYGVKPRVRSAVTRQWMAARDAGRVKIAALAAPDFYGPGVGNSHIGDVGFGMLARGKAATLLIPPDVPHDFAYAPDIGRMVATLLDAPDEDFGQAWHSPCAPTRTSLEILRSARGAWR